MNVCINLHHCRTRGCEPKRQGDGVQLSWTLAERLMSLSQPKARNKVGNKGRKTAAISLYVQMYCGPSRLSAQLLIRSEPFGYLLSHLGPVYKTFLNPRRSLDYLRHLTPGFGLLLGQGHPGWLILCQSWGRKTSLGRRGLSRKCWNS